MMALSLVGNRPVCTEKTSAAICIHDHVEGPVGASLTVCSVCGGGMLYSLVTLGAIEQGEQGVPLLPMCEFHINLGSTRHVGCSEMPSPMKPEGPLTEVSLTDGHLDTIHITE